MYQETIRYLGYAMVCFFSLPPIDVVDMPEFRYVWQREEIQLYQTKSIAAA